MLISPLGTARLPGQDLAGCQVPCSATQTSERRGLQWNGPGPPFFCAETFAPSSMQPGSEACLVKAAAAAQPCCADVTPCPHHHQYSQGTHTGLWLCLAYSALEHHLIPLRCPQEWQLEAEVTGGWCCNVASFCNGRDGSLLCGTAACSIPGGRVLPRHFLYFGLFIHLREICTRKWGFIFTESENGRGWKRPLWVI